MEEKTETPAPAAPTAPEASAASAASAALERPARARTTDTPVKENAENATNKEPPAGEVKKKKRLTAAEKKELRMKAEMEFKKDEIREELKRELLLSQQTVKRCANEWEKMFKAITTDSLRNELIKWKKHTAKMLLAKDEKICFILDDMKNTESMHQRNYSTQIQLMDFLAEIYNAFVETGSLMYETQCVDMLEQFYRDVDVTKDLSNDFKRNCENIMHASSTVIGYQLQSDYRYFVDKRNDDVNFEIEIRYELRNSIELKMRELQHQLVTFVESLKNGTVDTHKYSRLATLMERQRNYILETQKLDDIEDRSSRLMVDLQRDLLHVDADAKRKMKDLRLEHAYFVQMHKNIELQMRNDRARTYDHLKVLTCESYRIIIKYKQLEKYGELLLSLAHNCRKLQTESEKVVYWGNFRGFDDTNADTEQFRVYALNLKTHIGLSEEEIHNQIILMRNFWRRQAIAQAQVALLSEKRKKLIEENQLYAEKIKSMSNTRKDDDLSTALQITAHKAKKPPTVPHYQEITTNLNYLQNARRK